MFLSRSSANVSPSRINPKPYIDSLPYRLRKLTPGNTQHTARAPGQRHRHRGLLARLVRRHGDHAYESPDRRCHAVDAFQKSRPSYPSMSSLLGFKFVSELLLILSTKNERVSLPFTGTTSRMTTSDGKSTGYSETNEETELKDLVRKVSMVLAGARARALLIHVFLQIVS